MLDPSRTPAVPQSASAFLCATPAAPTSPCRNVFCRVSIDGGKNGEQKPVDSNKLENEEIGTNDRQGSPFEVGDDSLSRK